MRMMKFFAAVVIECAILSTISFGYSGGDGSATNPYKIASKADLLYLGAATADYSKCFIMTADIDMDPNLPGGQIFTAALIAPDTSSISNFQGAKFSGVFDGNHHIISNLTIAAPTSNYIGLFGYVTLGGIIRNLGVENVAIDGSYFVGGLVGFNSFGTLISCYSSGSIIGSWRVGGLAGYAEGNGDFNRCFSRGTVSGTSYVGGLVGSNGSMFIINCYSISDVVGSSFVGGLMGDNGYQVSNSYSTGAVSGTSNVGGLIGSNTNRGSIMNCLWDINVSGVTDGVGNVNPDPAGVIGVTTTEMKTRSTFTSAGWDFTNETANGTNDYWRMCADGVDYPRLNWESVDGDFQCPDGVSTEDLDYFVRRWLLNNCTSSNNYCGGADGDASGKVDLADFAIMAGHWMEGI